MTKSKKLTAIIATGCAAVMALSGTFAWILQQDETKLNEFSHSVDADYEVKIEEEFEPWVNKDVYVKNSGDGDVIVRARFEEFVNLDGKTNDLEDNKIYTETALTDKADSSKVAADIVKLYFGDYVMNMEDWNTKTDGKSGQALYDEYVSHTDEASGQKYGWWVIDTDGWCYYTQALGAGKTSEKLMDNAELIMSDEDMAAEFGAPANLDYNINVRLQAISADLNDYGSTSDTAQWSSTATNASGTGRLIEDDTENAKEILTDTTNTADSDTLIRMTAACAGYFVGDNYNYSIVDAANKKVSINGFNTQNVKLINQADGYDGDTGTLTLPSTLTIGEETYTVTQIGSQAFRGNQLLANTAIILPSNLESIGSYAFNYSPMVGTLTIPKTVTYVGYAAFYRATGVQKLVMEGVNNTVTTCDGEAAALHVETLGFADLLGLPAGGADTNVMVFPARTTYMGSMVCGLCTGPVYYPNTASLNGSVWSYYRGGNQRHAYTPAG